MEILTEIFRDEMIWSLGFTQKNLRQGFSLRGDFQTQVLSLKPRVFDSAKWGWGGLVTGISNAGDASCLRAMSEALISGEMNEMMNE